MDTTKELVIKEKPYFMWAVALVCFANSVWFGTILLEDPKSWWRLVLTLNFLMISVVYAWIGKMETLTLLLEPELYCSVAEKRLFCISSYNKFLISDVSTIKLKEAGKSSRCFYLVIYLCDGRCFSVFKSGVKERVLRKQIVIRQFIDQFQASSKYLEED